MSEPSKTSRVPAEVKISPWAMLDSCEIVDKWLAENNMYLQNFPPERNTMISSKFIIDREPNFRRKPPMRLRRNVPQKTTLALTSSPLKGTIEIYEMLLKLKAEVDAKDQAETSAGNNTHSAETETPASTSDKCHDSNGSVAENANQCIESGPEFLYL